MSATSQKSPSSSRSSSGSNRRNSKSDRRYQRRGEMRHSWLALGSVFMLIVAGCTFMVLKDFDRLIAPGAAFVVALIGLLMARRGMRNIFRSHGLIQGESHAKIGFWCNLIFGLLMFVLFTVRFVNALVNGQILF